MASNTEVKIYETPKKVYNTIAEEIVKLTQGSPQPRFDIVLSGGNSPKGLFKKMSKKYANEIPWERIHLWWADERCVPPGDDQSNYKMTVDYLLSRINIPKENIHRIRGEEAPEKEAVRYAEEIRTTLNQRDEHPVFDLILLGMGDDGHTASIFPGHIWVFKNKKISTVSKHPVSGQTRITLTGHVLNNANRIFFMVTGENKARCISEIMNDRKVAKRLPAYHIYPANGELIWFLDEAAASKI